MRHRSIALLTLLFAGVSTPATAQTAPELLGRVVAVVGDSVITNIDLQEALLAWQATTRQEPPTDSAGMLRLQHQLVRQQIDQLLLLQAATRDTTLRVSDEAISQAVEAQVSQLRQRMGGAEAFERALSESNLTLQTYRERLQLQQRRDALIQNYLRKVRQLRKPPPVTEEEIRAYFEENREAVGTRPPTITFRQAVLPIQPSDSALERTRILADSLLALARGGEDFAALARRYSEDPSRELGGDLGFSRPGNYVDAFDRALFSPTARPGDVVGPVRTQFGLHIIKVERIRGAERQARHILLRPEITEADRQRAMELGDSLAEAIRAGESVDTVAARFGDPDELVRVGPWRQDSLPAPYDQHLADAQQGEVVGPFVDDQPPAPAKLIIARISEVEAARPATVDDYRTQIFDRLAQDKLMEELLQELRVATYIDIRLADPGGGGGGG